MILWNSVFFCAGDTKANITPPPFINYIYIFCLQTHMLDSKEPHVPHWGHKPFHASFKWAILHSPFQLCELYCVLLVSYATAQFMDVFGLDNIWSDLNRTHLTRVEGRRMV